MPARQIKPKSLPLPDGYSKLLITESDKADARKDISNFVYLFSRVAAGTAASITLFGVGAGIWTQTNSSGAILLLTFIVAIVTGFIVCAVIRHFEFKYVLPKVVTKRLSIEHEIKKEIEAKAALTQTTKVEAIYSSQKVNLTTLENLLERAKVSLDLAQQLFAERAYTPFWDSIENTVESLRQFDKSVGHINQSAKEYYANLERREHTFPAFPLKGEDLPNPNPLIKGLTERINEAQRDFQFASIFEQRRTTSAIVTGFRNTQEAIASLENAIVGSLSDLKESLESGFENLSSDIREGFDDLAENQKQSAAELRATLDGYAERDAKHQKFTEDALDNIQNRRKPRSSETKEPFRKGGD